MIFQQFIHLWAKGWRSVFEIILLSVVIYYGYLYFRGTRGAKVLTGLAIVFLTLTLISTLLKSCCAKAGDWITRALRVASAVGSQNRNLFRGKGALEGVDLSAILFMIQRIMAPMLIRL